MIGKTLGNYKIVDKVGEGGMGVVYRARDASLDRDVAIKVLPKEMSGDPERAARFEREARTLASLQHANVASVYGYEQAEGQRFLVMELIEGDDLSDRLTRGAVPLDEARDIATQIATGLEAAHDLNIVHRDLKPANIKITPDGVVKILDFGLARAFLGDASDESNLEQSPTITALMTTAGVILGTAAYMSPEQARGKRVDKRSDMWAFGVILYEMLTGERLFAGETVSDTMAAVLRAEPDFEALPSRTPAATRRLLERCLQRDPRQRWRSAGDAVLELQEISVASSSVAGSRTPRWIWGLVGLLAFALVLSMTLSSGQAPSSQSTRSLHLDVNLPKHSPIGPTSPALSPDGEWLAFTVRDTLNRDVLYLRSLRRFESELTAEVPVGRNDLGALFWSPDSKSLGIQTETEILSMDVASRTTTSIMGGMAFARGASWSQEGKLIYAPGSNTGIYLLEAPGNPPQQITSIDTTRADDSHRWPVFLPDGNRFLFTGWSNATEEREEIGGIFIGALDGREPRRLLPDASQVFVDPEGYLLFSRNNALMAVPFDFDRGTIAGPVQVVTNDVEWNPNNGEVKASISAQGDLVIAPAAGQQEHTLGWLAASGGFEPLLDIRGDIFEMALSPTQRHAALDRITAGSSLEIWMLDLERGTLSLLSGFGSDCWGGVFSPDGQEFVYTSQDPGLERFYVQRVDGATPPRKLVDLRSVSSQVYHWSRAGELLFSHRPRSSGHSEIWAYELESGDLRTLLKADCNQGIPRLSPDEKWMAYESDESGSDEIFIRPYPGLDRKWQVSTRGGLDPYWSADGKRLVYRSGAGTLESVTVAVDGDDLRISSPSVLTQFNRRFVLLTPQGNFERFLAVLQDANVETVPLRFVSQWRNKLPTP